MSCTISEHKRLIECSDPPVSIRLLKGGKSGEWAREMIEPIYRTIAVASTFSPRFTQVLAEAKRIRDRFGSELRLIYVGERTEETVSRFASALRDMSLPSDSIVHYQDGDPAEAIIKAATASGIDLIVAGALEKEVVLRPFLGNVARRLVREAPCSVMLFTKPEAEPQPLRRIVLMGEYSPHGEMALRRAVELSAREKSEKLFVVRVHTTFDEARAKNRGTKSAAGHDAARTLEEEETALEEFIDSIGPTDVPIEARCIRGNTGYAASDFVQSVEASLLVIPISRETGSGQLPPRIAWVTDVIPCNLWVIR